MKAEQDLKNLNKEELTSKLNELRKEVMKLNSQVRSGANVKNPGKLKQSKKTIARLLQLLHERRNV
jgi:ribosomal protein L29